MPKFANTQLELALLNACIYRNEQIAAAAAIIRPEDFSLIVARNIWEYLLLRARENEPITLEQLRAALPAVSEDFWQQLVLNDVYINVQSYARSIRDLRIKEQVFNISTAAASELATTSEDAIDFTHELNAKLYAVLAGISDSELKSSERALNEFFEHYYKMSSLLDKSVVGVNTGFRNVNYHTKGFKEGELIVLAARPGQGKTTLALNITLNVLEQNVGVVFYSLEMPAASLMTKLLAINTQIPMQDLASGNVADDQMSRLQDSAVYLANKTLMIYDKGFLTIETLRVSLRRMKDEHPEIGLAVLDYIGLMSFSGGYSERFNQISEISRQLKLLALELQMPILVLSQLNRNVENRPDKVPQLSDIRDSGSIEQDADMIFFIHPLSGANVEYLGSKGIDLGALERPCVLSLAKNRSGSTGDMFFDFKASKSTFSAVEFSSTAAPLNSTTIG